MNNILKYTILLIITLVIVACSREQTVVVSQQINPTFTEYPIDGSIRALEVIDESYLWFAGSEGLFGWTKDGGNQWTLDSMKINGRDVEFRAIALTSNAVFLLNIASPAYLLRSADQGLSWDIVYQEDHPGIFYNSMRFWDDKNGIAVGDPLDGCLSVIITHDGGNNWSKLDCSQLPATYDGEAGFAASNTNIALYGHHVWLASGGKKARVFYSNDRGNSWEVFDTPISEGGKMTGIFSIDFYDENQGVLFGGDWENQTNNIANKAVTVDGGRTWQLINNGLDPGYRSCVQYIPNSQGKKLIATGIPGFSYTADGGQNWQHFDQDSLYTVRIAPSGKVAWLAGKNRLVKMKF